MKKIGALWNTQSKNGLDYLTGNIEIENNKYKIMVFKNNKNKETQPDYTINVKEEEQPKQVEKAEKYINSEDIVFTDDDLPF